MQPSKVLGSSTLARRQLHTWRISWCRFAIPEMPLHYDVPVDLKKRASHFPKDLKKASSHNADSILRHWTRKGFDRTTCHSGSFSD